MKVYHIIPKDEKHQHQYSEQCPCKPVIRDKAESGVENCWQHKHSQGDAPPLMVGGLMFAGNWTLYSVETVLAVCYTCAAKFNAVSAWKRTDGFRGKCQACQLPDQSLGYLPKNLSGGVESRHAAISSPNP